MTERMPGRTNIRDGREAVVCSQCIVEVPAVPGRAYGAPEGWESLSLGCMLFQACPDCAENEGWRNLVDHDKEDACCAGCGQTARSASVVPPGWLTISVHGHGDDDYGDYWTVCGVKCAVRILRSWEVALALRKVEAEDAADRPR